jgi:DNA-binding protein HU-beta
MSMNKADLIDALANDAGVTKTVAADVLESFINNVTKTLKKKGEVRLVGFGTFTTSKRKATTGRNPRTGATIKIAASIQPKFKAGKALKDELN